MPLVMVVSGSLGGEVSMQLVQIASAEAKERSVSFYCSVSCSGPQLQCVQRQHRKALRRQGLTFQVCECQKKAVLGRFYVPHFFFNEI